MDNFEKSAFHPDNMVDLEKAKVQRPGIRGGKFWIDNKGNVRYGERKANASDIVSQIKDKDVREDFKDSFEDLLGDIKSFSKVKELLKDGKYEKAMDFYLNEMDTGLAREIHKVEEIFDNKMRLKENPDKLAKKAIKQIDTAIKGNIGHLRSEYNEALKADKRERALA